MTKIFYSDMEKKKTTPAPTRPPTKGKNFVSSLFSYLQKINRGRFINFETFENSKINKTEKKDGIQYFLSRLFIWIFFQVFPRTNFRAFSRRTSTCAKFLESLMGAIIQKKFL